jgi:uncharacterized membrane protein YeaQ/YmgE (transglycosylase-associated protein family)
MFDLGFLLSIIWGLFWGITIAYLAYKHLKIDIDNRFSLLRFFVSFIGFIVVGGLTGVFAYFYLNI